MLQPFVGGTQAETPAANRVADDLSQRLLNDAEQPYVLDAKCTRDFFAGSSPAECPIDGATLQEQVGVLDRTYLNVTIRGNVSGPDGTDVLCWEAASEAVVERDNCNPGMAGDVLFTRGGEPSGSGGKTVSARRVASLSGHSVTIEVVMW